MVLSVFLIVAGCTVFESSDSDPDTDLPIDPTAPTVISTVPIDSSTDIARNTTINATFSEAMDPATVVAGNFTVAAGDTFVTGVVTYTETNKTATFTASSALAASTEYIVTVKTGMKNPAGKALGANKVWTFTTGATVDTAAPTVVSTLPVNSATNVDSNGSISATFSEAMDVSTIITANFTVAAGATPVAGTVVYDVPNKKAVFAPASILTVGTLYTATVTTGVKDIAGNPLAANKVWTFTTAPAGIGPAQVFLGTSGNFAILAKTAISTVPASVITGDVGISPAAESFMTGFSQTKATGYSTSPQVTGFMYAADSTPPTPTNMTVAISDMETAYTDAAGRVTPNFTDLHTGNLGGQTLLPGLYKYNTSVTMPSGVTIAGGANDVWIFQITGDLTLETAIIVTLSGGAQAKNIYWQVSGSVLMKANSAFKGIVLGKTTITLGNGATLNGRALAQTAVALDQAVVTAPVQ
jgi:hypothetical protein